jgi:hypothetical protein
VRRRSSYAEEADVNPTTVTHRWAGTAAALALCALGLGGLGLPAAQADASTVSVVLPGLDNPRGLTVGADGQVYVAEAGTGEPGSGAVVALDHGHLRTVAAGLPSAIATEDRATGPTNVAVSPQGKLVATIGVGPQNLDGRYNSLLRLEPGTDKPVADIQAFIDAHPDTTDLDQPPNPTDSNPYGVAWVDSNHYLVADAAANRLLMVGPSGSVRAVAKFPNQVVSTAGVPGGFPAPAIPAEAVPTSVAIGPDGYAYVGELKGFPFTPGTSRIWRVSLSAHDVTCDPTAASGPCTLFADGFTAVTGLDFGPDGSLYVVSFLKNGLLADGPPVGALYRLTNGVRTELAAGQLTLPGDVAVSRNGTVYVTNQSVFSGGGQVVTVGQ